MWSLCIDHENRGKTFTGAHCNVTPRAVPGDNQEPGGALHVTPLRRPVAVMIVVFVLVGATLAVALYRTGVTYASSLPAAVQKRAGASPAPTEIEIRDDAGRNVTVRLPVKRVVTLAPSNTEIVEALGLTSTIVGVNSSDNNPLPAAVKRIGFINPSLEDIVAVSPDLVLGIYGQNTVCNRLGRFGIPCVILSPGNLDGVMHDIKLVAGLLSADSAAAAIVDGMKHTIKKVSARLADCTTAPRVYFEIDGSDPSRPFSVGRGSFIDSLITMSHAVNIAHTVNTLWPQLSAEYIIAQNPDVIIMSHYVRRARLQQRPGWSGIKALREGRVYTIDTNLISRPDPEIVRAFVQIAQDIHPGLCQAKPQLQNKKFGHKQGARDLKR